VVSFALEDLDLAAPDGQVVVTFPAGGSWPWALLALAAVVIAVGGILLAR
jgi:hypothetical protein